MAAILKNVCHPEIQVVLPFENLENYLHSFFISGYYGKQTNKEKYKFSTTLLK